MNAVRVGAGFVQRVSLVVALLAAGGARGTVPYAGTPFGPAVAAAFEPVDHPDAGVGNRLVVLEGGYDALLLRIHLIRQATTSICVQTFIWSNDECGRLMMYELIEAARRGVRVRIIADHLFSEQDPATAAFLATVHPNLEIKLYRPAMARMKPSALQTAVATVQSFHDVNQRMHNKLMVFDEAVVITGGRNIENAYFDHSPEMNYRDRDVVAVGRVAAAAMASFEQFWSYRHAIATCDLVDVAARIARGDFRRYETRADYGFGSYFGRLNHEADDPAVIERRFVAHLNAVQRVTLISDEPGKRRRFFFGRSARITRELEHTLEQAQSSVVMQTPYLVLSNPARQVFRDLQQRHPGLRIKVSTNSFAPTDNLFAYSANYRLRTRYVEDLNLEVHEFKPHPASLAELFPYQGIMNRLARERIAAGAQSRPPFVCVHAKSLVVDDRLAFIGSYNLDPRSENLNTEVGLLIEDGALSRALRDAIERDMRPENSWVIARRLLPLRLETVNGLIGGVLSLSPVDVWPIQNTSSFELRPGATAVPPGDPAFHKNYREAGAFPGTEGLFTTKEILTRLYKVVGAPITPIL